MESTVLEVNTLTITHIVDNMHFLIYLYRVIVIVDKAAALFLFSSGFVLFIT
jgi:hypothetical protein